MPAPRKSACFSLGEPCVTLWTDESMGLMIATCYDTRSYDPRIVSLGQEKCNVAMNHALFLSVARRASGRRG
jgi:hypothetical protein